MALRQSVGELAATLLSIVRTRLELVALEASGQKSHWIRVVSLAFVALLFVSMAVLVFSVAVALYFWPSEHRYIALFALALIYAVLALILFFCIRRMLVNAGVPFSATLEELQRDIALLEQLSTSQKHERRYSDSQEPS